MKTSGVAGMRWTKWAATGYLALLLILGWNLSAIGAPPADQGEEVAEKRTRFSRTFYDPTTGQATLELSSEPLNYQDASGRWLPISTSIVPDSSEPDFAYAALRNQFHVRFPGRAHQPWRFSLGDRQVKFAPHGAKTVAPQASGNSIVYQDAWPGADLRYEVKPGGVKEEIVLHGPQSPNSYRFRVHLAGAGGREEEDGSIGFYDTKTGEKVWVIPAAYAYDSTTGTEKPAAARVTLSLEPGDQDAFLVLTVDRAWLDDPARVYPVVIDPTIMPTIYLDANGTASFTPNFSQTVQYSWHLEGLPHLWKYAPSSFSISGPQGTIDSRYTWDGIDSGSSSFWAQGGSTYSASVSRASAQDWFHVDYGIARLWITYQMNQAPSASPVGIGPASNGWVTSVTPSFSWVYRDSDGDPLRQYQVQVARDQSFTQGVLDSGPVSASVASGSTATHAWSGNPGLSDGSSWYWRVRVSDGIFWSAWSAPVPFRVDATPPIAAAVNWAPLINGVAVSWQPFSDGIGSGVNRYEVWYNTGVGNTLLTTILPTGTFEATLGGLADDQAVLFQVVAIDNAGLRTPVTVDTASAAAPTSIESVDTSGNATTGYQAAIKIRAAAASAYQVQRIEMSADGSFRSSITSPWVAVPEYLDTGLIAHGRYAYAVRTMNSKGRYLESFNSYPNNPVVVKNNPPPPVSLMEPPEGAFLNHTAVMLKGAEAVDPDGDALLYQIQWRSSVNATWSETAWLASPAAEVTAGAEGAYQWRILVKDGYMGQTPPVESEVREFLVDLTPPAVSVQIYNGAQFAQTRNVELAFTQLAPDSSGLAKIRVRNQETSGQGVWTEFAWVPGLKLSWTLPEGDGRKVVEAQALDRAGNWSTLFQDDLVLDTSAPAVPQITSAKGGEGRITVVWEAATDAGSGVAGYEVEFQPDGTTQWTSLPGIVETTADLTDLGDNQLVWFRVRARDNLGNTSAWSAPFSGCSLAGITTAVITP
ncbi:MAG TPA: hypothetical protein GXX28_02410, partial [Firmicutes bacterium]|nr:hypothetical protein [Bacillota bacterium]